MKDASIRVTEDVRPFIYDASVSAFIDGFDCLSGLLTKAEEWVSLKRLEERDIVEFRVASDMDPLRSQIQHASDTAKACVMRLAGMKIPSFEDSETTLAELKSRVDKTIDLLRSVPPSKLVESETRTIKINLRRRWVTFDGRSYVLEFALPNFLFHVTTAYAILRHNGLSIGKLDFLVRVDERRRLTQGVRQ